MARIRSALFLGALVVAALATLPSNAQASARPAYDHVFVIVEENHGFTDVRPNPAAPNLNALADRYGVATNYSGVAHPSEPNYVAMLGGDTFGIQDDNPYWMTPNTVNAPNLVTELDQKGVSWKAYLDGSPHAGYKGMCYPTKCNGSPDIDPLYVSKHNGIGNFLPARNAQDWARQVPVEQLSADLASGDVPRFGWVIPSECRDMHGDPPYCVDSGNPFDPQDQRLVSTGDKYLGDLVSAITGASFWAHGNNAIVINFDEGDDSGGAGGGRVLTVVVTSHGPRAAQDGAAYSHYSLLRTLQDNFGVGCLVNSCIATPMSPLFAVTGSAAEKFQPLTQQDWPTPTPTPAEPQTHTTSTPSGGGWSVISSPMLGTNDNSLGAVAASNPNDVWAVGNLIPDTATSNQDATISLAAHFDGKTWNAVPTPNAGPNFNTFFGAAAKGGKAWAVGVHLDADFRARALIEAWDGTKWAIASNPQPGPEKDILFSASAASPADVWAVGEQQGADGKFRVLVERWNGSSWSLSSALNPGDAGDSLYGVTALGPDDVWAVGQALTSGGSDTPLVEHWDGQSWSVVSTPATGGFAASLYSVAGSGDDGTLIAAGEVDGFSAGSRPLVERYSNGAWHLVSLPAGAGSQFSALWSVATNGDSTWAMGTQFDEANGIMRTLALHGTRSGWTVVKTADPGAPTMDDSVLSGVIVTGDGTWWAVGHYKQSGRKTLIARHTES